MEDKKIGILGRIALAVAGYARTPEKVTPQATPESGWSGFNNGRSYTPVFSYSYNGEKNLGEIGPVKNYYMDYEALRLRSWQAYLTSEIAQTVIKKYILWMIGSGLKLRCEPNQAALLSEGVDVDPEKFNEVTEARFSVFAGSKNSDAKKMRTLNHIAKTVYKNAILGGDVLVVLKFDRKRGVYVQLYDGSHVQSPTYGSELFSQDLPGGNTIVNGIELSPTGEHLTYFVRDKDGKYQPIPAKGKNSELTMAFLVYGLEYRLDNIRGIPLIAVVLEKIAKLDRYDEAAVASAEERAKIVYAVEHAHFSTGESPLAQQLAKAHNADAQDDIPIDEAGIALANTVAVSTNKQTFNLPIGATLKALESKNEMYFKDFFTTHIDLICATIGIPPNVAMSSYNDSFSASRAATKDWEHTLNVGRADFAMQFYQHVYNFWLEVEILTNKIQAPGYLQAVRDGNYMVMEAYRTARFTGAMFPHIDPLKEANAERVKLGDLGAHLPLTTLQAATEALNGGESDDNMRQYSEELKLAEELDLEPITMEAAEQDPQPGNKKIALKKTGTDD